MSYVKLVGVEMEGGWSNKLASCLIIGDESVKIDDSENSLPCWKHYGERKSPPLKPGEIEEWIRVHHPDASNAFCGLHVHVSFQDRQTYERTIIHEFHDYFYREFERFQETLHPTDKLFMLRLKGEAPHGISCLKQCCVARFCQRIYRPYDQMQLKHKDDGQAALRRTGINWAYNTMDAETKQPRKTIEIRFLPMFKTPDETVRAVKKVIYLFNHWLSTQKIQRPRIKGSVTLIGGEPGQFTKEEAA